MHMADALLSPAVGGVMWAVYQELVTAAIGAEMTILMFIVVIIGGLGSVTGCFWAAVLAVWVAVKGLGG